MTCKLTGITLVRNGNTLGYPYKQCVKSLLDFCDDVLINVDPCYPSDGTLEDIQSEFKDRDLKIHLRTWDMKNTGDGGELARQANLLLPHVNADWIVYMQADEMIHEKDFHSIRSFLASLPKEVSQVELYRTYFYRDLSHRLLKDEIFLGRIFRPGTHTVGGDGMYLVRHSGQVVRSPFWIYHYSRMGSEEAIDQRVKTLDHLFHSVDKVKTFPKFQYQTEGLVDYTGTHPSGIEKLYAI